jgi:hypothetical protein
VNGLGEFFFEIRADPSSGVIDMLAGPSEDALALFPSRVVALADGGSAFTFTIHHVPGTGTAGRAVRGPIRVAPARIRQPQATLRPTCG